MNYEQICRGVLDAVNSLDSISVAFPDSPERERLADLRRDIESGFYSIVLLGEFNRGKSTILNALLGQNLLPMDILPATAAIHILRFSREPVLLVHWRDGQVEELVLSAETLKQFASVESAESLTYLEIGVPAPILEGGVVFIDTPGVDDLNKQRSEVTYKFVPRSDAVIFVLDATAAVRRTEAEFLESSILADGIDRIVFVANFADLLDPEEEEGQVSAIRNRLAAALGKADRPVFLVSGRQALEAGLSRDEKQWNESGFPALTKFLEDLKTTGPQSIEKAGRYIRRAQAITSGIAGEIDRSRQLQEASDTELQQQLVALVRLGESAQTRRERIGQWVDDREREILAMVGKSASSLGEQLEEEIREAISDYKGKDFQQFIQEKIRSVVKRKLKSWAESHSPAIAKLLAQLHHELFVALAREFRREISIPSYAAIPIQISQTAFRANAEDVSGTNIHAGLLAGAGAALLAVLGAPILLPLVGMAGLPFLQEYLLDQRLDSAKAKAMPEVVRALRQGIGGSAEAMQNAVRAEIRDIRSAAESLYDAQIVTEQRRVEREMAQRRSERSEIRQLADSTQDRRELLNKIRQDLDAFIQPIFEEAVSI